MTREELNKRAQALENNQSIQRAIDRAKAWNTFKSVGSDEKDYAYLQVDFDQIDSFGIDYIDLGCSYFELEDIATASRLLCKGADILETIHVLPEENTPHKSYYGLIAAMAFYAGMQYSRAFVLIGKIKEATLTSDLISLFLRRRFDELTSVVEDMAVNGNYFDETISRIEDVEEARKRVFEITIAKSLYCFLQYYYTGDNSLVEKTREKLRTLVEITKEEMVPDLWLVARLLLIIVEGFNESSLWNVLSHYFDIRSADGLARRYILALVYKNNAVTELFPSQRGSLPQVLNHESKGVVVSIPTSSGKTRIAEIAIIDVLTQHPEKKILYIAPYRSLAFEIENSFGRTLGIANINVTHLYGGGLFTRMDEEEIDDASVIIATPEKAKAIYRCLPDLFDKISLIIMDEGHLIGGDDRGTRNEMFYEELRIKLEDKDYRCLLLSAVLPNSSDLSYWLSGEDGNNYQSNWRPSQQKCGILVWYGATANINWYDKSSERSFNNRFVVRKKLPRKLRQRKDHFYPEDKNGAVVETARKLQKFGSVLIIVPQKSSCNVLANLYLQHMPDTEHFEYTDEIAWKMFELACKESYGENASFYQYALHGIFCHNAGLYSDARVAMERLLQTEHPHVVIATTTLGQGVNLGVSSVILSTNYISRNPISKRDFWNIAGRAGRAFVDNEGKVLIAYDYKHKESQEYNNYLINELTRYFDKDNMEPVWSGVYSIVDNIYQLSQDTSIEFDTLLSLMAENKLDQIQEGTSELQGSLDKLDDCLLSLQNSHGDDLSWIDAAFSKSLAYIQAERHNENEVSPDMVIGFTKARIHYIRLLAATRNRSVLISSGLPLKYSVELDDKLEDIIALLSSYITQSMKVADKINLLKDLETLFQEIPSMRTDFLGNPQIDEIRRKWLMGVALKDIITDGVDSNIITKYYTFTLPWELNGVRRMIEENYGYDDNEDDMDALADLALCVETGLPDKQAIKIYRSGIRSRVSALEISNRLNIIFGEKTPSRWVQTTIIDKSRQWKDLTCQTKAWIDVLRDIQLKKTKTTIPIVTPFEIIDDDFNFKRFKVRIINGEKYFLSLDLDECHAMEKSDLDKQFIQIENLKGVYFDKEEDSYRMNCLNPYYAVEHQR